MKKPKVDIASYHGRRTGSGGRFLPAAAVICLLLSAVCGFVLPGVRFSAALFLCLAGLCGGLMLLDRWAAVSQKGRLIRRIALCALCVALTVFLAVEGMILSYGEGDIPEEPVSAVIVLGAGVNGRTPSLTLHTRIESAAAYLKKYPDVPAVLSGGQGPGEDITEAQAMYAALVSRGISAERLLLEEKSTSTAENIAFSKELLATRGIDTAETVAIVTNDFHQFRAQRIAAGNGLTTVGIPAELPWWWLNANYYVREFFALGKLWLTALFS